MSAVRRYTEVTRSQLESRHGGGGRWEAGGSAYVCGESVTWVFAREETDLVEARRLEWRSRRRIAPRHADAHSFLPRTLQTVSQPTVDAIVEAPDGALIDLGDAHVVSYGYSDHASHGELAVELRTPLPRLIWERLGGFGGVRLKLAGNTLEVERAAVGDEAADAVTDPRGVDLRLTTWDGRSLTLLSDGERVFVMALECRDDLGAVAMDPASAGDHTPVALTLGNGQVDHWPRESTVSTEQAVAIARAWVTDRLLDTIAWTPDPPMA